MPGYANALTITVAILKHTCIVHLDLRCELDMQEGAIVARMSAVEEMAGMDILCSDKTGTLTLNQLSVDKATVLVTVQNMPYAPFPDRC